MGDDIKSTVDKLLPDGSNWVSYRDRLRWALEAKDIQEHLTSDTITQNYIDIGNVGNMTPNRHWRIDDAYVKQVIAQTVTNDVFARVKMHTHAKDVWDALKGIYEGRSSLISINLSQRLQNTRCGEDEDVHEHFAKLTDMREQLASMGETITDVKYRAILQGSLPPSYSQTFTAIAATTAITGTDATPAVVIRLATDEYDRRLVESGGASDEALTAEARKGKKGKKRDIECFNCHKKGHTKAECWAKGGGNEGGGPKGKKGKKGDKEKEDEKGGKKAEASTAEHSEPEIDAWAVIEEIEETPQVPVLAMQGETCNQSELYDSGASRHMSPFRKSFTTYRKIDARPITAANNQVFHAIGMGDLSIDVPNGESSTKVLLRDVLHAPDLGLTVVSIGRIVKAGFSVEFDQKSCNIKRKSDGKKIGSVPAGATGLYKVDHALSAITSAATTEEPVDILTLHRRLGHLSANSIRSLLRANAVTGVHVIDSFPPFVCDSCEHAKTTRKVIQKERQTPLARAFGDEVHTDVWGPSPTYSLGGRRYYVTFTDDYSRFTRLEVLRTKDEALDAYKSYAAWARTQHGARIKSLRSDRGGEFTGHQFTNFLRDQGTERRLTTADTPQHNGVAESLNRRLLERVRAMLHQAGLPKTLWGEATQYAVWLKNRTSTRALGNTTPYERLYRQKPNLSNLPEWGQNVWVYNPKGSKLDARAKQARWIGFDADSTHAHRIYWVGSNKITVERNVKFVPTTVVIQTPSPPSYAQAVGRAGPQAAAAPPAPPAPQVPAVIPQAPAPPPQAAGPPAVPRQRARSAPPLQIPIPPDELPPEPGIQAPPATPTSIRRHSSDEEQEVEQTITPRRITVRVEQGDEPVGPRRSTRVPKPSDIAKRIAAGEGTTGEELDFVFHADFDDIINSAIQEVDSDPKTLAEARSRSDWHRWKEAMDREIATLEKAGTWETVLRPAGKNIVGSKWVFRIKRKADGSIDKYKARLVARGFTQIFGVDYFSTYSPVAKLTSFRAILAIAARYDWNIESFDFNGAYLNGELDANEEIYMQAPPGYESDARTVKYLRKSLYGLKQAGRRWYDTLVRTLTNLGFSTSVADPGVFHVRVGEHMLVLAVHVDDCILTGSNNDLIAQYKAKLNACHALTDLGPVHWLLGIKITRDRSARIISLSQASYIDAILSRFALSDAKSCPTPMTHGTMLTKEDSPSNPNEIARMGKTPYREAIGSLMYAAVATRPDIAFAVSYLSQFLENPGEAHWEAAKRVFRYLAGTKTMQLTYGGEHHELEGYTDADGAMQEHRHAISGYAFLLDGGAISWSSKKQELVTLSTAEAEYVAATHAAKEAIWLRKLLGEIMPNLTAPTPFYCDNQAALKLATEDNYHARTKHIDVRYHFIRQTAASRAIKLLYCRTEDMIADLLTKALSKNKTAAFTASLGMRRACGGVV